MVELERKRPRDAPRKRPREKCGYRGPRHLARHELGVRVEQRVRKMPRLVSVFVAQE